MSLKYCSVAAQRQQGWEMDGLFLWLLQSSRPMLSKMEPATFEARDEKKC